MSDWVGRTLSKVNIQRKLGRGGMAEVYLGLHTTLNRQVAVKILHAHLTEDDEFRRRFMAEAQSVAALRHPNIVQVFDFDIVEDRPYMVMELLEGMSLAEYLRGLHTSGLSLPVGTVVRLTGGIASALDYAHHRGIVHRDIKPANIMLRQGSAPISVAIPLLPDVDPVITDFGIARLADSTVQTATGTVLGTPAYMSPEQVQGQQIDHRSDLYSLGIVVYEMLAGRPPFDGDTTPAAVMVKHLHEAPPPVPQAGPEVQRVITRALAKDPQRRYQRAGEFAHDLSLATQPEEPITASGVSMPPSRPEIAAGGTPLLRQRWLWGVVVLGAVICLLGAAAISLRFLLSRPEPTPTSPVALAGTLALSPTQSPASATPEVAPTPAVTPTPATSGWAVFHDGGLTAQISDVPPAPEGFSYSAWLGTQDGETRSLGQLVVSQGQLALSHRSSQGENLLGRFDRLLISLEPDPDPDPSTQGDILYSAQLDSEVSARLQRLSEFHAGTPLSQGVVDGLARQVVHYSSHLNLALSSVQSDSLAGAKTHSEHVINIVEGEQGELYGDWNGDERVENPGDDFGLLPYMRILEAYLTSLESWGQAEPGFREEAGRLADQVEAQRASIASARDLASRIGAADTLEEVQPLAADLQPLDVRDEVEALLSQVDPEELSLVVVILRHNP